MYGNFNYTHVSGRQLTQREEEMLNEIDLHPTSMLGRLGSIGRIHYSRLTAVEVCDKASRPRTSTFDLADIKAERDAARDEYQRLKAEECMDMELLRKLDSKMGQLGQILNNYPGQTGIITQTTNENLLGLYIHQFPKVQLFIENIGTNTIKLVSTYVHEMFHAYFATSINYPELEYIEEPLVEYSTLMFLKEFDKAKGTNFFKKTLSDVYSKQNQLGSCHYGFGAGLYDLNQTCPKPVDWTAIYKKANDKVTSPSADLMDYAKMFEGMYPYNDEPYCADLLYRILLTAAGRKRISSILGSGTSAAATFRDPNGKTVTGKWKPVFRIPPRYFFDRASQTLGLDGEWENASGYYFHDMIECIYMEVRHKYNVDVQNVYIGSDFVFNQNRSWEIEELFSNFNIIVSPANKYLKSEKGIPVLKKNNKPALPSCGEGYYIIHRNGKCGVIDSNLKPVVPYKYGDVCPIDQNGLFRVVDYSRKPYQYGCVDTKGKPQIPLGYDHIHCCSDGTYKVKKGGVEYYIDKNGNKI